MGGQREGFPGLAVTRVLAEGVVGSALLAGDFRAALRGGVFRDDQEGLAARNFAFRSSNNDSILL